jgi:hypothetical protein
MADLVAALKANTSAVSWGGGSAGGTDHITVGLVAKAAGADATKINYVAHSGGGEAMAAVLGNHVSVGINSISEFIPQVKAGKLKIIGVSSDKRVPGIEAPTFKGRAGRCHRQLARCRRGARDYPGAACRSRRANRQDGQVAAMAGQAQGKGLGGQLPFRRRLR